jgi:hypothetical protein
MTVDVIANAKIRLDIGCGDHLGKGWVGMDVRSFDKYDAGKFIQHDIEDTPWPLPDDCAEIVQASHIMEHVLPRKFIPVMNEMHRVLEHEGQAWITGPYGWSHGFVQDPTHTKPLNETLFAYFTPQDWVGAQCPLFDIYKPRPWKWVQAPNYSTGGNLIVILSAVKNG